MTDELTLLTPSPDLKVYDSFDEMNLPENLLRGIFAFGFEKPSDIQSKAIKPIADGRDRSIRNWIFGTSR